MNYLDNKTIQKYESIKRSPLLNDLENIWDEKELNIIYNLFQLVIKSSEEKIVYLKSIDDIITLKKKKFIIILINIIHKL